MSTDPLADCLDHVLDRDGRLWSRVSSRTWATGSMTEIEIHDGERLLRAHGPITPLVPGEPIHPEPAEPAEPRGLGAVVRDANGRRYLLSPSVPLWIQVGGGTWSWFKIPRPVTVLSEGVDPEQAQP